MDAATMADRKQPGVKGSQAQILSARTRKALEIRASRTRTTTGDDFKIRPSHIPSHNVPKKNTPTATPCSGCSGNTGEGENTQQRGSTPPIKNAIHACTCDQGRTPAGVPTPHPGTPNPPTGTTGPQTINKQQTRHRQKKGPAPRGYG